MRAGKKVSRLGQSRDKNYISRQEVHQVVLWAFLKITKFSPYNIVIATARFHLDSLTNWKETLPSAATHTFYIYIYYEFGSVTSIALEVFTSNICIDWILFFFSIKVYAIDSSISVESLNN